MPQPRRRYPSDHRPYFRVLDSILDDKNLGNLSLNLVAVVFRTWAMLNRGDCHDGRIILSDQGIRVLTKRNKVVSAISDLTIIDRSDSIIFRSTPNNHRIVVPNWPVIQGFHTAALPQDSKNPSYSSLSLSNSKKNSSKRKSLETAGEILARTEYWNRIRKIDSILTVKPRSRTVERAEEFWSEVFYALIQAERTRHLTPRKVESFLERLEKIPIEYVTEGLLIYLKRKYHQQGKGWQYAAKICRNIYEEEKTRGKPHARTARA